MKKLMIAALTATALMSTPAFAQTRDGIGQFALSAPIATFCEFGTVGNSFTQANSAGVSGDHSEGFAGADGRVVFGLQNTANNTVNAAFARFVIPTVICNTAFSVSANSVNGGLKTAQTTSDTDFTSLVNYNVDMKIDGIGNAPTQVAVGDQTLFTSPEARAGAGQITIDVPPSSKLLIEGTYLDTVTFTMTPSTGGSTAVPPPA